MAGITLMVPSGNLCEGCMFLSVNHFDDTARCCLFGRLGRVPKRYGQIDVDLIEKCSDCPSGEVE